MSGKFKDHREAIEIFFGESNPLVRSGIRNSLQAEGFKRVEVFYNLEPVRSALARGVPDLLILDTQLEHDDIPAFVRALRRGEVGINPFVVTLLTVWGGDEQTIGRLMQCGADDVLIKPVSARTLIDRIDQLIGARRPFLSTTDYTGPDRRGAARSRPEDELVDVPNTLRLKAMGVDIDPVWLTESVAAAWNTMGERRLTRDVTRTERLAAMVCARLLERDFSDEALRGLADLRLLGTEVARFATGHGRPPVASLALAVDRTAEVLQELGEESTTVDLYLLASLAQIMVLAMKPGKAQRSGEAVASAILRYHDARMRQMKEAEAAEADAPDEDIRDAETIRVPGSAAADSPTRPARSGRSRRGRQRGMLW